MDIEDRAEKWAREYADEHEWSQLAERIGIPDLIAAYLAGSAQTQADYAARCTFAFCVRTVDGFCDHPRCV